MTLTLSASLRCTLSFDDIFTDFLKSSTFSKLDFLFSAELAIDFLVEMLSFAR
jgi:hypothetical protein